MNKFLLALLRGVGLALIFATVGILASLSYKYPQSIDWLGVLIVIGIIFTAKYVIYDWIGNSRLHQKTARVVWICFYVATAIFDCYILIKASEPNPGNLAIFAAFMYTPPLLIIGLAAALIVQHMRSRSSQGQKL